MIAGLWSTMVRNKAIAEARAIDLSPEKVLIFGAVPQAPSTYSPVCPRAESIFTEADTEKKREAEEKIDEGRKIEE